MRIVLSFVFLALIHYGLFLYAGLIFIIAAFSDFLDGYLARKWHVESSFGSNIDPLADKILMSVSYLYLYFIGLIPSYVVITVILRDAIILFAVTFCIFKKISIKIEPLFSSKINTALQIIYVIVILSCKCFSINVPLLVDTCSLIICLSTFFSAFEYVKKYYWIKDEIWKFK